MPDDRVGSPAGGAPAPQIPVSPNNPCPFLRALVAGGFVDGHIVPLPKLTRTIEAATGEKGLKEKLVGLEILDASVRFGDEATFHQVVLEGVGLPPIATVSSRTAP